ncbi:GNAT family N-acetyltransferase [Eudoraea adriatica]|uniref:GNAT family N-acetyltransferase n=1 Tax=Eudoraea adriatica TaxID=446681 RepID=UPI000477977C|nr:GNAT family N-acetyltransferase [Eudoraea adriatica]
MALKMRTCQLNINQISKVVELHELAFKGFFLTELGTSFLNQYYKSVIQSEKALNLGVFDENSKLLGFAITAKNSKGFNKSIIKQNFLGFLGIAFKLLILKPKAIYRLFINLEKKSPDIKDDKGNYSELLSIATHPNKQGLGIGKKLLIETEKQLKSEGYDKLALTTDYHNNIDVIRFYEKSGYSIYYDFITYPTRKMYKLIKTI